MSFRRILLPLLIAGLGPGTGAADWVAAPGLRVLTDGPDADGAVTVRVHNPSADALSAALRLVVSGAGVVGADGHTADGRPWVAVPVPAAGLPAGALSAPLRVQPEPSGALTFAVELDDTPFPLQLLHVSDIDSTAPVEALNNVKGFSALLGRFRADPILGPHSLTVSSGDNWIPGPRYNAANDPRLDAVLGRRGFGRGDVALLNAMGFAASAVGNHELDRGPAEFVSVIAAEGPWPGAAFPYLSANLDFADDPATAPLLGQAGASAGLAATATVSVAGQTIGLVGASTPTLPSITNPGAIGVAPPDATDLAALAAVIQHGVNQLRAVGVNKLVLLAHMQQIAVEQALAPRLRGVDIIVAGGSNTRLCDADDLLWPGDIVDGPYPIVSAGADGRPVLIVNTDGDYKYLGRLVVAFDAWGVIDAARLDPASNGAWATSREGLDRLGLTAADADPGLTAVADGLLAVVREKQALVLGLSDVYLNGDRDSVRRQETNLGDLTADALRWFARQQDPSVSIALKNGGGMRSSIGLVLYPPGATDLATARALPPYGGQVSQLDVEGALAFNNGVTLLTLSAARLWEVLEYGFAASAPGATPGQFPQVSGLMVAWDPRLPPGARVRELAVVDDDGVATDWLVRAGELQGDPARRLRLVTLSFLANGGDGYPLPRLADGDRVELTQPPTAPRSGRFTFAADGSEQDVLAEYLAEFHASRPYAEPETPPAQDRRISDLSGH